MRKGSPPYVGMGPLMVNAALAKTEYIEAKKLPGKTSVFGPLLTDTKE